jgi:hypothetical protein
MSQITQKSATGALALQANGVFQTSTDANLATLVGTRWDLSDGREVILVSTSSTGACTAGQLYQDAALVANHQNIAVTTVTAYSTNGNVPASVAVTLGATALTASQYQGGFAVINAGTGIGQTLRIASNPAALASATNVTITFEDGPNVALSTSDSKVSLIPAHGSNVIVSPTTPTNVTAGVGLNAIPASSYGFLVSKGLVSSLSDAKIAGVGQPISPSVTTAGTTTASTSILSTGSNGTLTSAVIGYAAIAAVSAEARTVFINV